MLWLKLLPIVLMLALGLTQLALDQYCRYRRTTRNRQVGKVVVVLFVSLAIVSAIVLYYDDQDQKTNETRTKLLVSQNEQLTSQVARLQEDLDDAKSARLSGILVPANEERPSHSCGEIPETALALFLGNQVAWVDKAQDSIPVLSVGGQVLLTLYRTAGGIYLSAIVIREDGRGVATVFGNAFGINPNNYFRIASKDRHELAIVDKSGGEVLHARFINETTFKVTGVFFVGPNQALVVEPEKIRAGGAEFTGMCLAENKIGDAIFGF